MGYILVIALALMVPVERANVGKLIPVETVFLYMEKDAYVVETDTGNIGAGNTAEEAVKNLYETAPGLIFLDTADYLLLTEQTEAQLGVMGAYLKEKVRVCKAEKGIELEKVSEYLSAHQPKSTLKVAKIKGIEEKIEQYGETIKIS